MEQSDKLILMGIFFTIAMVLGIIVASSKKQQRKKKKGVLKYVNTTMHSYHSRYTHTDTAEVEFSLGKDETVYETFDRFVYERNYKEIEAFNEQVDYEEVWETNFFKKEPYFLYYNVPKIDKMTHDFNKRYSERDDDEFENTKR